MEKLTPKERLIRARVKLQELNPFFSYLVLHLKFKRKELEGVGAAVDNKGNLFYDPEFIRKLSKEEIRGLLIHEVLHLCLDHLERAGTRRKEVWNVATDYVVNNIVKEQYKDKSRGEREIELPKNVAFREEIGGKEVINMTAEEVYDHIKRDIPRKFESFDRHIEGEEGKDWRDLMIRAAQLAKTRGELPAGMEVRLDEIVTKDMDWRSLLHRYIERNIPTDYTWRRPSKKSRSAGVYLPSVKREGIKICVSIDTSGSISEEELSMFMGEVRNIVNSFKQIDCTVIVSDSEVYDTYEIGSRTRKSYRDIELRGRGGTDHRAVFDWVDENKPHTKVLLCLTDAYTKFPETEPSYDTIWVLTANHLSTDKIPFGKIVTLPP